MTKYVTVVTALLLLVAGCKKTDQRSFQVMLTDAPFNAEEVNVDIREVRVNYSNDTTGWVALNTNAGIYNLLNLQNNIQTVLATGSYSEYMVKELRLILGSSNSIKINNATYPLNIPLGGEAGLKIKVNKKMSSSLDKLVVDFDAGLSVKQTGNNEYWLKPVLRIK
jgi:hypothetical protein